MNGKIDSLRSQQSLSHAEVAGRSTVQQQKSKPPTREKIFLKEPNKGEPVDGNIIYSKVTKILTNDMRINIDNIKLLPKSVLISFMDCKEKERATRLLTIKYKGAFY